MWSVLHSAHLNASKATITTAFLFVVYVTNKQTERKRERESKTEKDAVCLAGM